MMNRRGSAIAEVLIASLVFTMAVAYICDWLFNANRLFKLSAYQYVAMNLARDVLEFGAGANFGHPQCERYYYYPPAKPRFCLPYDDHPTTTGYGLNEYWTFAPTNPNPFQYMGDIQLRNLVPPLDPKTVDIGWNVIPMTETNPNSSLCGGSVPCSVGYYQQYVYITWEENGVKHKQEYSTISYSQHNTQLNLSNPVFSWQ